MIKILFALLFLTFTSGCLRPTETIGEANGESQVYKFRFGEAVYITEGFYKGCHGRVTDARHYFDGNRYTVDASCYNGSFSAKPQLNLKEEEIIHDDSTT